MASTTTQTEEQVSLKLLVNKDTNKVLFAEAGKDFVDILCSFLTLPLGTITRLVEKESNMEPITVGCLNSLYHSVEDLNPECLKTETCKDMLLQPGNSSEEYCSNLKLNIGDTEPKKYFMCANLADCKYHLLSTFKNQRCECGSLLDRSVLLQSDKKVCNGFVKDASTFIVTDDLIVMPNSMGTSFVQSFGIKTTSSVKEITVNFTEKQVLDLLKYSLLSKSTLTNLFLEKEPLFIESKSFSPCDVANNSTIQIKVKLFLRKTDGEILFAQGEEDFADFLFSFLTFPLGGIVRMLGGNSCLGSIDTLYKSIADLDGYKYMMSNEVKNSLVDPCIASQFKITKQMLQINEPRASSYYCYYQRSFRESIIHNQFSISYGFRGYNILKETYTRLKLVDPKSSKESHDGCYVKGPALFMVTNDLAVEPMSPISAISLLDRLETPPSNLSEKVVFIGVKEGLSLLKAALTSRSSALTNGLGHLLTEFKEEKWYIGKCRKGTGLGPNGNLLLMDYITIFGILSSCFNCSTIVYSLRFRIRKRREYDLSTF